LHEIVQAKFDRSSEPEGTVEFRNHFKRSGGGDDGADAVFEQWAVSRHGHAS
jgi:hypothetical protein